MSFIKKMIEGFNQKILNKVKQMSPENKYRFAAGVLGVTMIGSLISCGNNSTINQTDNVFDDVKPGIIDTIDNKTESNTNKGTTTGTEANVSKPPVEDGEIFQYKHSDVYYSAQKRWGGLWNYLPNGYNRESFLSSPAPFSSLYKAGMVYYTQTGEPRIYGVDEEFDNSDAVQTRVFIDEKTASNDVYLVTQSVDGTTSTKHSNGDIAVYSTMLKYDNLPTDLYMDILLLSGDYRLDFVIQEMDEQIAHGKLKGDDGRNSTCQVLSESIINYDLISSLGLFETSNGKNNSTLQQFKEHANYVEAIDYQKGVLTINYSDTNDVGKIYSYTYNIKETPGWESCLVYNEFTGCITKEQRDNLTMADIMQTYDIPAGKVLDDCRAGRAQLRPTNDQKATAKLKYELTPVTINSHGYRDSINLYENGKLKYNEVNALTSSFINNFQSGLTK